MCLLDHRPQEVSPVAGVWKQTKHSHMSHTSHIFTCLTFSNSHCAHVHNTHVHFFIHGALEVDQISESPRRILKAQKRCLKTDDPLKASAQIYL